MAAIILPDRWRRQPSGPAVLAPEWAKGARFVVSAGSGRVNLANGLPSIPGSRGISPSIGGLGLDYSSTADTPTNTGIDSFESSVNVTIFSCFIVRTAVAWSACIYDRNGWNGGTFGDDGLSYRYVWDGSEWSYSTGLTFGTNRVVAAAHSISANSAICAVDGRTDTRSVSNSARGFENFANWFGSDPNGGRNLNGVILLAGICVGESWSGPRLQEWTKNPWQIFRKQPRILYFTAPSVGGATIAGDSGTYTLTGSDVSLKAGRKLAADSGTYSLTGTAAALRVGRKLAADSGSYSLSGTDAAFKRGYALAASSGTYTVSGTAVSLKAGRKLAADSGSYTLTGTDATLTYAPAGSYNLTAESGSYSLTGTAATLRVSRKLSADSGAYSLTGTTATLAKGVRMAAASGSYTLTGSNVSFARTYVLTAESGSYTLTGTSAGLTWSGAPVVEVPTNGGPSIYGKPVFREREFRREYEEQVKRIEDEKRLARILREDEEIICIMALMAA